MRGNKRRAGDALLCDENRWHHGSPVVLLLPHVAFPCALLNSTQLSSTLPRELPFPDNTTPGCHGNRGKGEQGTAAIFRTSQELKIERQARCEVAGSAAYNGNSQPIGARRHRIR